MKKTFLTLAFMAIATSVFAYSSYRSPGDEIGEGIIGWTIVIMGILNIVLFSKIWTMTNDVHQLKEQLVMDKFPEYQLRQKMVEEYMQVLTNPEAPEKEVEEANQKIQQLMKIDNQETVLEELIRKEGYQDAVVITNLPHVDVIVQSEKLDKKQVVKLISLVRQHLQVDPHHVTVAYR